MLNLGLTGIMFCKTEKAEKVSRHFISFLTETKLFFPVIYSQKIQKPEFNVLGQTYLS